MENMMSKTITDDVVDKAEAAAEQARDKARELRAAKDAADAAAREAADEARDRFEAGRRDQFESTFVRAVRDAQAAFDAAVAERGDVFAAWIDVQAAAAVAAAERRRFVGWEYQRAADRHDRLARELGRFRERLQHLANTAPKNHDDEELVDPRVEEFNEQINAWAESNGLVTRRDDRRASQHLLEFSTELGPMPSTRMSESGGAEMLEPRSFTSAFDAAAKKAGEASAAEHASTVTAQIRALTPDA